MENSLVNSLLTGLFSLVIKLLRFASNIILLPFTGLLNLILPNLSEYTSIANLFINRYLLNAIACGREIILNITGFPQELITISVNVTLGVISYIGILKTIAFVKNMWRLIKGG